MAQRRFMTQEGTLKGRYCSRRDEKGWCGGISTVEARPEHRRTSMEHPVMQIEVIVINVMC